MSNPPTQFQSMSELVDYLKDLERRVSMLEDENLDLKKEMTTVSGDSMELVKYVKGNLPGSMLFSPRFMSRAFAVWGHYFVAQLMIGVGVVIVYIVLMLLVFGVSVIPGSR
jgi:hypothetical protein